MKKKENSKDIYQVKKADWKLFTSRDWLLIPVELILAVMFYGSIVIIQEGTGLIMLPLFMFGVCGVMLFYLALGRYIMKIFWKKGLNYRLTEEAVVILQNHGKRSRTLLYEDIESIVLKKGIAGTGSICFNKAGVKNVVSNMGFDILFPNMHPDAFFDVYDAENIYTIIVEKIKNKKEENCVREERREKHSVWCVMMDMICSLFGLVVMTVAIGMGYFMGSMTGFYFAGIAPAGMALYGYFISIGRLIHVHRKKVWTEWKVNDEIVMSLLEKKKYKSFKIKMEDTDGHNKKDDMFMQHLGMDWFIPGM